MTNLVTLDTNLYISFFTRRNEEQFLIASKLISNLNANKIEVFLPSLVVSEIFYILIELYDFEKLSACQGLQSLVNIPNLVTENKEILLLSIENYLTKNLDFVDCYLLAISDLTRFKLQTFDKKLKNQTK